MNNNKIVTKLNRFLQTKYPVVVWFVLGLVAVLLELSRGAINNYLIYKGVFTHTIQQQNLYLPYPELYGDTNHYGPVFSMLIAPFALLPNSIGVVLWAMFNVYILYKAIRYLPLNKVQQNAILLIGVLEMMTSIHNVQINPSLTASLIFTYALIKNEKDFWACLCIALGFYIKLYGIVGLLFWLFSKHKIKFIGYFFFWLVVLFALPMLLSSPQFIVQCYHDWYNSLVEKNIQNTDLWLGNPQDISVMGMIKRIFYLPQLSNLIVLLPGLGLFLLPMLRFKQYTSQQFQLYTLASTLLFLVLFSTSSESPTYVIAVTGVAIWYMLQPLPQNNFVIGLLIFMLFITCLSTTDLVPRYFKVNFIRPYALKALPCFIIWLVLIYQMLTINFVSLKKIINHNKAE
jgi:Glycosyltransferase family 87